MKKILIISLYGNNNYGNKLQNYATQVFFNELKIDSDILAYQINKKIDFRNNINFKKVISKIGLKIKKMVIGKKILEMRKENFMKFNANMKYTKTITQIDQLYKMNSKYDYNIIGSDQIWGLNITNVPEISFASFATKGKNISFAASFGINTLPATSEKRYIDGLKNIQYISVRENEGRKIVKKLIGIDAEILLDPTMLIEKNKWDKLSKKTDIIKENEKFILVYFVEKSSWKRMKKIREIATKHKYRIVSLNDYHYKKMYTIGPSEFIYLIKKAEIIYTDSFHCAAFSILYDKNFYTLNRIDTSNKTNSRIHTLLEKFELKDRAISYIDENIKECIYTDKERILAEERKKAEEFIKKCMNI